MFNSGVDCCYSPLSKKFITILLSQFLILGLSGCANRLAPANRTVDFHPAVKAFFESKDPYVKDVVIPNIDANRKSDVNLQFVSADGKPLAECNVSAELKRHKFHFGHCDLTTEKDTGKRELLNELFYYTCPGNITKWKSFSPTQDTYNFSKIDTMLDYCKSRDITIEWHFLTGYHPKWLESVTSDSEKGQLQMEHGIFVLERYHDKVKFFQVFNEDWLTHIDRGKVFTDQTAYFSLLRKKFPDVELGVCDCWEYTSEKGLPDIDTLTERYPGIDFISMHAHRPRKLWASPEEMYNTYNPYLNSDIKVHVTEFGIIKGQMTGTYRSGEWDEKNLAEYFVQAMATAFSHKAVRVFNLWSNYEKFTGNRLFTEESQPNIKYLAIKSLIQDKLATQVAGKTNRQGKCTFRGFHGKYDITIEHPSGNKLHIPLQIDDKSTNFKLIMVETSGAWRITH